MALALLARHELARCDIATLAGVTKERKLLRAPRRECSFGRLFLRLRRRVEGFVYVLAPRKLPARDNVTEGACTAGRGNADLQFLVGSPARDLESQ
ncbi:MAG: hypothetical protein AB7T06_41075 [Kofleriaceae bacterium]